MSTRWRLYRETLPEGSHLEGEIVVGLPLSPEPVNTIQSNTAAAPFHLFFPTKISSGTPFLLHGYFELAARRASFYGGSEKQNRSLLQRLGRLVSEAVLDAAASGVDLAPLAHLLGQAVPPEDPLALSFQQSMPRGSEARADGVYAPVPPPRGY